MKSIREPLSTVTQADELRELLAQHLTNDNRAPSFRKTIQIPHDVTRVADRLLALSHERWDDAAEVLQTELAPSERQSLVAELEGRAQTAARQATYFYKRIAAQGDRGHKIAAREQNTVGRKLHKAFGYDGRSCPNLAL